MLINIRFNPGVQLQVVYNILQTLTDGLTSYKNISFVIKTLDTSLNPIQIFSTKILIRRTSGRLSNQISIITRQNALSTCLFRSSYWIWRQNANWWHLNVSIPEPMVWFIDDWLDRRQWSNDQCACWVQPQER